MNRALRQAQGKQPEANHWLTKAPFSAEIFKDQKGLTLEIHEIPEIPETHEIHKIHEIHEKFNVYANYTAFTDSHTTPLLTKSTS